MSESQASLDPTESTRQQDPRSLSVLEPADPFTPNQSFRHSGWMQRRLAVHAALQAAAVSNRRLSRFATCGAQAWILKSTVDSDTYRLVPDFCHDRWCVPCAKARGHRIAQNVTSHVGNRRIRFLGLTLARDDLDLKPRLDRLLTAFQRLRRTSIWKERVLGGCAFIEITRGAHGDHWHPHLHVLIDGRYLPKEAVALEWQRITGDSYIVDINQLDNLAGVAYYVTKYSSKPLQDALHRDPNHLVEAIEALRGRKLIHPFGTWVKLQLLALVTKPGWRVYAHINDLLFRDRCGNEDARLILTAIVNLPEVVAGESFGIGPDPP